MWAASRHKGFNHRTAPRCSIAAADLGGDLCPVYLARAVACPQSTDGHLAPGPDFTLRDDARRFQIGNYNFSGIYAMSAALDLILWRVPDCEARPTRHRTGGTGRAGAQVVHLRVRYARRWMGSVPG